MPGKNVFFWSSCIYLLLIFQNAGSINVDCKSNKKCYECIQMPGCKWCADENGDFKNASMTERCFRRDENLKCDSKATENPDSKEISSSSDQNSKFQPSKVNVRLRKGEKLNVTFEYNDEKNRPLDLYILVDLSSTMQKHIKKIEMLTETLVKKLKELTNDLKLGFGSFVDKPVTPYSNKLTYSYKNHLSLVKEVQAFKKAVATANASSNIDAPEGGLDALMQAIVCSKEIGWRTDNTVGSRRIIVLSTDETFHFAGDGKLGGIISPNDGRCHLENDNYPPEYSTRTDYPSISQIRDKLYENDVYVIFAVTNRPLYLYENLANELQPFAVAQVITDASDNNPDARGSIVGVIEDEYKKLVGTVNLKVPSSSSFTVKYYAKCKSNGDFEKRSNCTNMQPGSKITFKVEIELKRCSRNNVSTQTLEITPSLGSHDVFKIEVESQCGCQCETKAENNEGNGDGACNNGFTQCGICKCHRDWGGKHCQCSISTREGQSNLQMDCFRKDDHEPCSGRGQCNCGQCVCPKNSTVSYSGNYCECDDFGCAQDLTQDKGVCNSELGQGKCHCNGTCECFRAYSGTRCQCPPDNILEKGHENCLDPKAPTSNCNGHGTCTCKQGTVKCNCKSGYAGEFCEIQHAKDSGGCKRAIKKWEPCIRCLTLENSYKDFTGNSRQKFCEAAKKCGKIDDMHYVDRITKIDIQPEIHDFNERHDCRGSVKDAEHCDLFFIVSDRNIHTDKTKIFTERIVNKNNCPAGAASMITIIASVVGSTLLIGILTLLIWKVVTHIHDKREYQRFESERNAASWGTDDSPLYKPVVSEFKNPAYSDQE